MSELLRQLRKMDDITSMELIKAMIHLQGTMSNLLREFMDKHPDFPEREKVEIITTGKVENLELDGKLGLAFAGYREQKEDVFFAPLAAAYCYGLVGIAQRNRIHWDFAGKTLNIILNNEEKYRKKYPQYLEMWVLLAYMIDFEAWKEGFVLDDTWQGGSSFTLKAYQSGVKYH